MAAQTATLAPLNFGDWTGPAHSMLDCRRYH